MTVLFIVLALVLTCLGLLVHFGGPLICPACGRELDPYQGKPKDNCQWCGWQES
jgi:hypothetical protein